MIGYYCCLLIYGGLDFKQLLTEKEGVSKLARWWIRSGRLNQFRLANELIKGSDKRTPLRAKRTPPFLTGTSL
jgi:hypothetical protein